MNKPKVHLSDRLQETIAYNQESNCDAAKAMVATIDSWMTLLLGGHPISGESDAGTLKLLQTLNVMKQDYQSFIIE